MKLKLFPVAFLSLAGCAGESVADLAAPVAAAPVGSVATSINWRAVDAETGKLTDIPSLEQLSRDFPQSGSVRLRLLSAYLGAEDKDAAFGEIGWLHNRGYRFSEGGQRTILGMYQGQARETLAGFFVDKAEPIEASSLAATVPAEALLLESVIQHPATGRLFATSVIARKLFRQEADGSWTGLSIPGANSLSGLAIDPGSSRIWVSSADLGLGAPDGAFHGLIAVDSISGEVVHRIAAPDGVNPSDLMIGSDGTLFVSDPLGGAIYRARPDDDILEALVTPGTFRSPQGLAQSADGLRIYVSDYRYGLAIVDLASGAVERMQADAPMLLDGIDGLWRRGGELIAVQNGTSPMRISAIKLSDDGRRAVSYRVLEQAHSAWTEPMGGALSGDSLIYVGNGQWDRYGEGGVPIEGKSPMPTEIRALPLQ